MPSYSSLDDRAEQIRSVMVSEILKDVAFREFEEDRGVKVHQVLPDSSDDYKFSVMGFEGDIFPDKRLFKNPVYNDMPISKNRIIADPEKFVDIVDPLYELWADKFNMDLKSLDKTDDITISRENLKQMIQDLSSKKEIVVADPLLDDLIDSIQNKNYRFATQLFNLDVEASEIFEPGGTHELTDLFTNGEINIVYKDNEIVLLKPYYFDGIREEVMRQQTRGFANVRMNGEQPELAFVMGIDDTPTGLFVHAIDGTHLDGDQDVTRQQIHDVMDFDYNYRHESYLDMNVGDRVRIQGDLAVEYVDDRNVSQNDTGRCNLPIDNHLCMIGRGDLPPNENKNEEPILVDVPEKSVLNIMHDEHNDVSVDLKEGRYRFYLLTRGILPGNERPRWR